MENLLILVRNTDEDDFRGLMDSTENLIREHLQQEGVTVTQRSNEIRITILKRQAYRTEEIRAKCKQLMGDRGIVTDDFLKETHPPRHPTGKDAFRHRAEDHSQEQEEQDELLALLEPQEAPSYAS